MKFRKFDTCPSCRRKWKNGHKDGCPKDVGKTFGEGSS